MEEVYAGMLLHKAGKDISEDNVKKILEAAGIEVNDGKIKALVASLEGVDIEAAIKEAAVAPVSASSGDVGGEAKEVKEEKKEEDDKKSQEEAAAGLGALFG
jgi:large subunit ribosomal protein L12